MRSTSVTRILIILCFIDVKLFTSRVASKTTTQITTVAPFSIAFFTSYGFKLLYVWGFHVKNVLEEPPLQPLHAWRFHQAPISSPTFATLSSHGPSSISCKETQCSHSRVCIIQAHSHWGLFDFQRLVFRKVTHALTG